MNYALLVALMFFGEGLAIVAEVLTSVSVGRGGSTWVTFMQFFGYAAIGGAIVLFAYAFGMSQLKNAWAVSAISIAAVVIIEPIVLYYLVGKPPSFSTLAGFSLAVLGLIVTLTEY